MGQGYNVFVLQYSVGPRATFEQALKDGEEALCYIRDKAAELRIEKNKIAVVGFSAGGHLAASLGTLGKVKPDAMILGYPVILEYMSEGFKEFPGLDTKVDAHTSPAFVFATQDDTMVPIENSITFLLALAKVGIPFESHIFLSGDHGFSLAIPATSGGIGGNVNEDAAQWFALSVRWLKKLWGDYPYTPRQTLPEDKPGKKRAIDITFGNILKNEVLLAVVKRYIPDIETQAQQNAMMHLTTPRMIGNFTSNKFSPEMLEKMDADLEKERTLHKQYG
jgi:acetyl esterase/lipase